MTQELLQISLIVKEERFVFRYPQGCEASVVGAMSDMAASKEHPNFSWYEAAVMNYSMAKDL